MSKKVEQGQATAAELIQIAREIFARDGYGGASMQSIVKQAGVTRGALYHHFSGKEGLFRAVVDDAQARVGELIMQAVEQETEPWQQLIAGCRAFLSAASDPTYQRIVMIDAPAALGAEVWREIDEANTTRLLNESLTLLSEAGVIKKISVDALTHLLAGAMNEASLWISTAEQPEQALAEAQQALETLLESIR